MRRLQELLQEHFFDQAPIMTAVLDRDYRIVEANGRFRQAFGEWAGKSCFALCRGRDAPCEPCMARKVFEDGRVRVHDEGLTDQKGGRSHYIIRVAPLSPSPGETTEFIIWMASDVKEATNLVRENWLLFEKAPCYLAVLDPTLRIVRANQRVRETFGAHKGQFCFEAYRHKDVPCEECPARRAFETGEPCTAEYAGVTREGKQADYIMTASPMSREEGQTGAVNYLIMMATDVTQVRHLEKEVLDAERLSAVGQTVAGLAHGIKNILMGMEGGVYVMQSGLKKGEPPKVERGMAMLSRNVEKISTLAKNLLSFSKGTVPEVSLVDPNGVAWEILELYGDMAKGAGVQLSRDLEEGLDQAPMDHGGIHACLANLVSNAIDACQMSDKPGRHVTVRTREDGGALCFEVSDDGCGMDYDVKSKLFTTFFTTKGVGGTGLGLLMTRKIVQEHGGRIEVESLKGEGTTFRILLPRDRLPKLPDPPPQEGGDAGSDREPERGDGP